MHNYYSPITLQKNSDDSNIIVLEEILNTIQTEEILKIILTFKEHKIKNDVINNLIYSLNRELDSKFMSKAYFLETFVIRKLAQNVTFISTLQKMRFSGYDFNVEKWFDSITGIKGSLKMLCNKLEELQYLESKLGKGVFLKNWTKYKITIKFREIQKITNLFSTNCIYK